MQGQRSAALNSVGKRGAASDEIERSRKVECVIDRAQMVEMRRLCELDEGQTVTGIVRVKEIAGKGEEFTAILGLPVVVERVEFLKPVTRSATREGRGIRSYTKLPAAQFVPVTAPSCSRTALVPM